MTREQEWQLKYGRAMAAKTVYMQMLAALVRRGAISSDEGQAWLKKADAAGADIRLEDFVVAKVNK